MGPEGRSTPVDAGPGAEQPGLKAGEGGQGGGLAPPTRGDPILSPRICWPRTRRATARNDLHFRMILLKKIPNKFEAIKVAALEAGRLKLSASRHAGRRPKARSPRLSLERLVDGKVAYYDALSASRSAPKPCSPRLRASRPSSPRPLRARQADGGLPTRPTRDPAPVRPGRSALLVTGGIAAYKPCWVVRGLVDAGCSVRVAMTAAATRFS